MDINECLAKLNNDAALDDVTDALKALAKMDFYMPMRAEMSEADAAQFANAKKGDVITTEDNIRLEPTTMRFQDDKTMYLPIFSSEDEIKPSYGKYFSKVKMPMSECVRILHAHEKASGLVLNMFSGARVIKGEALEIVEEALES